MECACANSRRKFWRLRLRSFARALGTPAQELMQGKGNFVGVRLRTRPRCAELDGHPQPIALISISSGFDDLRVSHRTSSMATPAAPLAHWLARYLPYITAPAVVRGAESEADLWCGSLPNGGHTPAGYSRSPAHHGGAKAVESKARRGR